MLTKNNIIVRSCVARANISSKKHLSRILWISCVFVSEMHVRAALFSHTDILAAAASEPATRQSVKINRRKMLHGVNVRVCAHKKHMVYTEACEVEKDRQIKPNVFYTRCYSARERIQIV